MKKIFEFINQYTSLSDSEKKLIEKHHSIRKFKKNTYIPIEVGSSALSYFILDGEVALCREDLDREVVSEFYFSGEPVIVPDCSNGSYLNCLRETTFAVAVASEIEKLMLELPRFEIVCRKFGEERLSYTMQFNDKLKSLQPLEKYLYVVKERPKLASEVPQRMLAQYLGLAPETLSRVRSQLKNSRDDSNH